MTYDFNEMYPGLVIYFYNNIFNDINQYTSSYDFTNLATAYLCNNQPNKSLKILQEALNRNKTNPFTFYLILMSQFELGKITDGYEMLDYVPNRDYHYYLPDVLRGKIPLEEARYRFEKSLNASAYLSSYYGALGYKLLYENKKDLAQEYFRLSAHSINYKTWYFTILSKSKLKGMIIK
jgi:tetratricopeptide (TPR) repeat protein